MTEQIPVRPPGPPLEFSKYEGLGNDFIIIFVEDVTPELARFMCDRHFGIGADGVIRILPASNPDYDFHFRLFNSDGGQAEVSGNGLRCVGRFLHEAGLRVSDLQQKTPCAVADRLHGERLYADLAPAAIDAQLDLLGAHIGDHETLHDDASRRDHEGGIASGPQHGETHAARHRGAGDRWRHGGRRRRGRVRFRAAVSRPGGQPRPTAPDCSLRDARAQQRPGE